MSAAFQIKRATKAAAKLRLALVGPSGSGKTYTALSIAQALAKPVAVIDTERGSASKYADVFEFDVLPLDTYAPDTYVAALDYLRDKGYGTVIVDSLSHAWMGKDGALEQVDRAAKRTQGNSFVAWRDVTPMHNRLVDALLAVPAHLIVTMRAKTEYVLEEDHRGKKTPRKVGMAPIQRDGLEYEFDVVGDLDVDNNLVVTKTRCSALAGQVFRRAGADVAAHLHAWLDVAPAPAAAPAPPPRPPSTPPPSDTATARPTEHRETSAKAELDAAAAMRLRLELEKALRGSESLDGMRQIWKRIGEARGAGKIAKADVLYLDAVKDEAKRRIERTDAQRAEKEAIAAMGTNPEWGMGGPSLGELAQSFAALIDDAPTVAELRAIGEQVSDAHRDGKLSLGEYAQLVERATVRSDKLDGEEAIASAARLT